MHVGRRGVALQGMSAWLGQTMGSRVAGSTRDRSPPTAPEWLWWVGSKLRGAFPPSLLNPSQTHIAPAPASAPADRSHSLTRTLGVISRVREGCTTVHTGWVGSDRIGSAGLSRGCAKENEISATGTHRPPPPITLPNVSVGHVARFTATSDSDPAAPPSTGSSPSAAAACARIQA